MPNDAGEVTSNDVKRMWESLLRGDADEGFVQAWAERFLTTYADEPTYRGLYRLTTRHFDFAAYCDWLEIVHWYRDDPAEWNKWYFLRFAAALPAVESSRKAFGAFLKQGGLREDDPDVAAYSAQIGGPIWLD